MSITFTKRMNQHIMKVNFLTYSPPFLPKFSMFLIDNR